MMMAHVMMLIMLLSVIKIINIIAIMIKGIMTAPGQTYNTLSVPLINKNGKLNSFEGKSHICFSRYLTAKPMRARGQGDHEKPLRHKPFRWRFFESRLPFGFIHPFTAYSPSHKHAPLPIEHADVASSPTSADNRILLGNWCIL